MEKERSYDLHDNICKGYDPSPPLQAGSSKPPDPMRIRFVEITPEDHIFIEDIYKQIIKIYVKIIKSGNGNSAPEIERVPTFQHAVKFLTEHAIFNENDMEKFVDRFIKDQLSPPKF